MESSLRTLVTDWLRAEPDLSDINAIEEESPLSTAEPWLGLAASASADWSTKDRQGREVRLALELMTRSDDPAAGAGLIEVIEQRVRSIPPAQSDFTIINTQFLRARTERRANNRRATLLEFRFRMLAN